MENVYYTALYKVAKRLRFLYSEKSREKSSRLAEALVQALTSQYSTNESDWSSVSYIVHSDGPNQKRDFL